MSLQLWLRDRHIEEARKFKGHALYGELKEAAGEHVDSNSFEQVSMEESGEVLTRRFAPKLLEHMHPSVIHMTVISALFEAGMDKSRERGVFYSSPRHKTKWVRLVKAPIDVDMVDLIVALNKAGYVTEHCCSGKDHEGRGGYISFEEPSGRDFLRNVGDFEGWEWEICYYDHFNIIARFDFESLVNAKARALRLIRKSPRHRVSLLS